MERSVMPWRVLDAEAERAPAETGSASGTDPWGTTSWGTVPVLGGLAVAAVLSFAAIWLIVSGPAPVATISTDADRVAAASVDAGPSSAPDAAPGSVVVHVAGAVLRPGLVTLEAGSRVADAIEAAGGFGPRADPMRVGTELNLAAPIADGERVVVPSRDDQAQAAATDSQGSTSGVGPAGGPTGPVDLNRATAEQLEALPGIGPVTAGKIMAAREERPFRTLDELVERKVVGPATLAKFRDLAVVR
jgi:competence protein ComEA